MINEATRAIEAWSQVIYTHVPIHVTIRTIPLPGGELARTLPPPIVVTPGTRDTGFPLPLAEMMLRLDLNPGEADIVILCSVDLKYHRENTILHTLLHEIAHGLGFMHSTHLNQENQRSHTYADKLEESPICTVFDRFIEDEHQTPLCGNADITPPFYFTGPHARKITTKNRIPLGGPSDNLDLSHTKSIAPLMYSSLGPEMTKPDINTVAMLADLGWRVRPYQDTTIIITEQEFSAKQNGPEVMEVQYIIATTSNNAAPPLRSLFLPDPQRCQLFPSDSIPGSPDWQVASFGSNIRLPIGSKSKHLQYSVIPYIDYGHCMAGFSSRVWSGVFPSPAATPAPSPHPPPPPVPR